MPTLAPSSCSLMSRASRPHDGVATILPFDFFTQLLLPRSPPSLQCLKSAIRLFRGGPFLGILADHIKPTHHGCDLTNSTTMDRVWKLVSNTERSP